MTKHKQRMKNAMCRFLLAVSMLAVVAVSSATAQTDEYYHRSFAFNHIAKGGDNFTAWGFLTKTPSGQNWAELDATSLVDKLQPVWPWPTAEVVKRLTPPNETGKSMMKYIFANVIMQCENDPTPVKCRKQQIEAGVEIMAFADKYAATLYMDRGFEKYRGCIVQWTTANRGTNFIRAGQCMS
jgi:hypothetical protein